MNITITGASGLIGRRLVKTLAAANHTVRVLSRHAGAGGWVWDPEAGPPPAESLTGADAVVHLAGEPVAQRWTAAAKERIRSSRVAGTRQLVDALAALPRRPGVLVSASAVGYYGNRGDDLLTEQAPPGTGFLAEVCQSWEAEAERAAALGMRVVRVRIGVVLAPHGGALAKMLPAFRAGVGGRVGSGRQWMSWIHLEDLAALLAHAVEHPLSGAVNGTAPSPVVNAEFTRELAHTLGRPAIFPVPAFTLKLLFGEMAAVLLDSQRAVPAAARACGFRFRYSDIAAALKNLLPRHDIGS